MQVEASLSICFLDFGCLRWHCFKYFSIDDGLISHLRPVFIASILASLTFLRTVSAFKFKRRAASSIVKNPSDFPLTFCIRSAFFDGFLHYSGKVFRRHLYKHCRFHILDFTCFLQSFQGLLSPSATRRYRTSLCR